MQADVDIVVPAGPGDQAWRGLLPQLASSCARHIVLALSDSEVCHVQDLPANLHVVHSKAGRAIQLNAGARASSSKWLWFLHADSRVTSATREAMLQFVHADTQAIGYFRLHFLDDGPRWTFINAWGAYFRSRVFGLPFGDQGLLMPRRVFDALEGFDESVDVGEDHDLIWSARSRNIPVRAINAPVFTSARKYAEHGWWRTTREHLGMTRDQARRFSQRHQPSVEKS